MTNDQNSSGGRSSGLSRFLAVAGAVVLALGVAVVGGLTSSDKDSNTAASIVSTPGATADSEGLEGVDFGREHDIVLGDENAPVWVVEYASTSCGHCKAFKEQVFPQFKEKYIDSGLVKYTLREFPTAPAAPATWAFMLARCTGEAGYYRMIEAIFAKQREWAFTGDADKTKDVLLSLARQAGLSEDEFNSCISNEEEFQRIRASAEEAFEEFGVDSTPSFIINGMLHKGAAPFEVFEQRLAPHLPEGALPAEEDAADAETQTTPAADDEAAATEDTQASETSEAADGVAGDSAANDATEAAADADAPETAEAPAAAETSEDAEAATAEEPSDEQPANDEN